MFKKILAGIGTLVLASGLSVIAVAGPAQATHPLVTGNAECNPSTGDFDIAWRVAGDTNYPNATATIVTESLTSTGDDAPVLVPSLKGETVKDNSFVESAQAGAQAGNTYTLSINVSWSTNHASPGHASVTPSGTCATPPTHDAAAAVTTTAATCDVASELILGDASNATWGNPVYDGADYSVVATADAKHRFDSTHAGVSTDGTTQTFTGVLEPQKSGAECTPPPNCIPGSNVSYTYDKGTNGGVITVEQGDSTTDELCEGFFVTATGWKYTTAERFPQALDEVQYVHDKQEITKQEITKVGAYDYEVPIACGQGDIYASFDEQPEPTEYLNGPKDPFNETFLHEMGFTGTITGKTDGNDADTTYTHTPNGECNTMTPVEPAVTMAVECDEAGLVTPVDTAGVDYAVELNKQTGEYTVTATPKKNFVFEGEQIVTFTGNAGAFVECVETPSVAFGECEPFDLGGNTSVGRTATVTFDNSGSNRAVEFAVVGFPDYSRTVEAGEIVTVDLGSAGPAETSYEVTASGETFDITIPGCDLPSFALVTPTYSSTQPTCIEGGTYTLGSEVGDVVWTVNGVEGITSGTYTAPADNGSVTLIAAPADDADGLDPSWTNPATIEFTAPSTDCAGLPTLPLPPGGGTGGGGGTPDLPTLAYTGAAVGGGISIAAALMFLGITALIVARRRKGLPE